MSVSVALPTRTLALAPADRVLLESTLYACMSRINLLPISKLAAQASSNYTCTVFISEREIEEVLWRCDAMERK